jgi:DNA-binding NarL/FixJ family response regulator
VIRVIVIADSGPVLASLTAAVGTVPGAYIVRHCSSAAPLARLVEPMAPDLVVIGDMLVPEHALARLAEVRRAAPAAQVIVSSSSSDASWLADALRAHAAAVLPGNLDPDTLGLVLREVLAERPPVVHRLPLRADEPPAADITTGAAA